MTALKTQALVVKGHDKLAEESALLNILRQSQRSGVSEYNVLDVMNATKSRLRSENKGKSTKTIK